MLNNFDNTFEGNIEVMCYLNRDNALTTLVMGSDWNPFQELYNCISFNSKFGKFICSFISHNLLSAGTGGHSYNFGACKLLYIKVVFVAISPYSRGFCKDIYYFLALDSG